jgi:hypothetical protein
MATGAEVSTLDCSLLVPIPSLVLSMFRDHV